MSTTPPDTFRTQCPTCQKPLVIPANLVGKKGKCPGCGAVFPITLPAPQPLPPQEPYSPAAPANFADNMASQGPYPTAPSFPNAALSPFPHPQSSATPPAMSQSQAQMTQQYMSKAHEELHIRRERDIVAGVHGWGEGSSAGNFGGCGMMFAALVWFVVGLLIGKIFIYPPVLFIIGLLALCRGISIIVSHRNS